MFDSWQQLFEHYWSLRHIEVNLIVFANLFGALLLGLLVGYERAYHGRAAGMRTYGLVCMASCAVTVISGYPGFWYGGSTNMAVTMVADPTRVIQGVVTGVGFLGAGVIMKEGMNISGLTTAASIWSSSAIGILIGVGFYSAGILLAVLSASLMMWASKVEQWLPSRPAIAITLRFRPGFTPQEEVLRRVAFDRGYDVAGGTFQIQQSNDRQEWRYVAIAHGTHAGMPLSQLADELRRFDGVEEFHLAHARN